MSETTNIAWATSTFNPWIGCTKVGPGCDHCYASVSTPARTLGVEWGAGKPRRRTSEANWRQPLTWNRKARESGRPWRVFCASLADVFDNEVPKEWRLDLGHMMWTTPHLTWMLLTKRIGNAAAALLDFNWTHFPPNVWLGATVVNQEEADRDIPKLLAVPAAVRFLSIEPMLGPIDLTHLRAHNGAAPIRHNCLNGYSSDTPYGLIKAGLPDRFGCGKVDWVIVGGESNQPGHRARPFNIAWARSIVAKCEAAGVPVFVKQMGSFVIDRNDAGFDGCGPSEWPCGSDDKVEHDIYGFREEYQGADVRVRLLGRAGADPSEWPEDLRVREFPR